MGTLGQSFVHSVFSSITSKLDNTNRLNGKNISAGIITLFECLSATNFPGPVPKHPPLSDF